MRTIAFFSRNQADTKMEAKTKIVMLAMMSVVLILETEAGEKFSCVVGDIASL